MKQMLLTAGFILALAGSAQAACYADYQARKDNPFDLHYGVIELSDAACASRAQARSEASARLAARGWTLSNILSTFGREGLTAQRQADAGQYYLRF